ncbi:MAG: hypothetical protein WC517_03900 [Patescibacteria group bacterium]
MKINPNEFGALDAYLKELLGGDIRWRLINDSYSHCWAASIECLGRRFFVKNVEPRAIGAALNQTALATMIANRITEYLLRLKLAGVITPEYHDVAVVELADRSAVVVVADDCGSDLALVLRESVRLNLDRQIKALITGILAKSLAALSCDGLGIDPPASNWTMRPGSLDPIYVDLWPVQYRDGQTHLVGFPQPDDPALVEYSRKRYYTVTGVLRIARFHLLRISATLEPIFFECATDIFGGETVEAVFSELPEVKVRNHLVAGHIHQARASIMELDRWHVDDLREIALRIIPDQPDDLHRLFKLTQMDFQIPDQERATRFEQAKNELVALT